MKVNKIQEKILTDSRKYSVISTVRHSGKKYYYEFIKKLSSSPPPSKKEL